MANRYWKMCENMGYAGTDTYETIDLCDYWGNTEEEVEEMTNEYVENELGNEAYQSACERVEAWAEPIDKEDME